MKNLNRTKKCIVCDKEFTPSYANFHKVKFCSMKCSFKNGRKSGRLGKQGSEKQRSMMRERKGILHPKWKGGTSRYYRTGYYSNEYKEWRMKVFERDEFKCQCCGIIGTYITAHHIKSFAHYPELRFVLENGITLCEPCHSLTDNYKGRNKNKK